MGTEVQIKFDRSLLGVKHRLGSFHVTRELIGRFTAAIGETGPLYTDEAEAASSEYGGIVAPPTFYNVFISGFDRPDIKLEFGDLHLFGSQAIECLGVVRPGDTLEVETMLKEVYPKTGRSGMMVFVTWETIFRNQRDETVALVDESYVHTNRS